MQTGSLTVIGGHAKANPFTASELAMRVVLMVDYWYADDEGPSIADAADWLHRHLGLSIIHAKRLLHDAFGVLQIHYDPRDLHIKAWLDNDNGSIEKLLMSKRTGHDRAAHLIRNAIANGVDPLA